MNPDLLWVLGLLAGAISLFVIGKPRMDVVALLVLVALPLTGVLDLQQTLAGFSDANVILIAALFVIGDGLVRTGIAYRLGDWLVARAGSSETRLLILLMLAVAGLGSVMSSTGVVAIFIPVGRGNGDQVKAKVADFNNSFFGSKRLKVTSNLLDRSTQVVLVKSFPNMREGMDYYTVFTGNREGLIEVNSSGYEMVLISNENYVSLFKNKNVIGYAQFFAQQYLSGQ